jgi:hypothetical protein
MASMSKFALAEIGGQFVGGWKERELEPSILAEAWTFFKMKGFYSDEAVRDALKKRGLEVRAVET